MTALFYGAICGFLVGFGLRPIYWLVTGRDIPLLKTPHEIKRLRHEAYLIEDSANVRADTQHRAERRKGGKAVSKEFRVVSNGIRFRVEKLEQRGFWFWKRFVWVPKCACSYHGNGNYYYTPIEYKTRAEADSVIAHDIAEAEAKKRGWEEVSLGKEMNEGQV